METEKSVRYPKRSRANRQGIALIVTLWVIMLVSTIAMTYTFEARIESQVTGYRADSLRAYYVAKSGLTRAMVLLREDYLKDWNLLDRSELVKLDTKDVDIRYDARSEEWAWGPAKSSDNEGSYENYLLEARIDGPKQICGKYTVEVVDECSKININEPRTTIEVLQSLIMATGFEDEDTAQTIAAAIVDYRDQDEDPSDAGDERDFGEADTEDTYWNPAQDPDDVRFGEGPEYICKNLPFGSVNEILLILEHLEKPPDDGGMGILEEGESRILFFGEDENGNGKLDPNERDGNDSLPPDNGDGDLWLGIRNYLTVDSIGKVNLNTASMPAIAGLLAGAFDPKEAVEKAPDIVKKRDGHDTGRSRSFSQKPWRVQEDIDIDEDILAAINTSGLASLASDSFTIISTGEYPAAKENAYVREDKRVKGVKRTIKAVVFRDYRPDAEIETKTKNRLQKKLEEEKGEVGDPRDDDPVRIFIKRFTDEI